MVDYVSVQGGAGTGGLVEVKLNAKEISAAQTALNGITAGHTLLVDIDKTAPYPASPDVNIFSVDAVGPLTTVVLDPNAEAAVMRGTGAVKLTGRAADDVLIGNSGKNTIDGGGGNDTIIAGDGKNNIKLNGTNGAGGNVDLRTGAGINQIDLYGGNVTVSSAGKSTKLDIHNGNNTITTGDNIKIKVEQATSTNVLNLGGNDSITLLGGGAHSVVNLSGDKTVIDNRDADNVFNLTGDGDPVKEKATFSGTGSEVHDLVGGHTVQLSGNDTIYLGSGNDTIKEAGRATIYGGSGLVDAHNSKGALEFHAGSGNSTIYGGKGDDTFIGGSGTTYMRGGEGDNLFIAGSGDDTMDATKNPFSDLFYFDSVNAGGGGATHRILNFHETRDHIQLVGYDSTAALAGATHSGGNTTLTLSDGTKIVVVGFTLQASDFS